MHIQRMPHNRLLKQVLTWTSVGRTSKKELERGNRQGNRRKRDFTKSMDELERMADRNRKAAHKTIDKS